MSHLKRPRFIHLSGNVMEIAEMIVPNNTHVEALIVSVSRELLIGYLLYALDTLHCYEPIEYTLLDLKYFPSVQKGIQTMLKGSLEIQFYFPEKMKEGYFYFEYDEKKDAMRYAVMKGARRYAGEITDEIYDHFKQKLKNTGSLPLKEVNFLIEKLIKKGRHLKKNTVVLDSLCRQYFSHFLTLEPNVQADAIQLSVAQLQLFENLSVNEPASYYRCFHDVLSLSPDDIEAIIFNFNQLKKHDGKEQLMSNDALSIYHAERYQSELQEIDEEL